MHHSQKRKRCEAFHFNTKRLFDLIRKFCGAGQKEPAHSKHSSWNNIKLDVNNSVYAMDMWVVLATTCLAGQVTRSIAGSMPVRLVRLCDRKDVR